MEVFGLGLKIQEQGAATVEATLKRLGGEIAKTVLAVGSVATVMQKFVTESTNAQYAVAQLEASLRSTNGVSGQTSEALQRQASALQQVSIYGDDAIIRMQSLLLTFTNIRGVIFTDAVPAILNLATKMGGDLQGAAIQVGKALNDPILGVSALGRAGIQFSDAQKVMIKRLVDTNQLAEAQKIILGELSTQFEGSAKAARDTLGGALAALNNNFGDLFELQGKYNERLKETIEFLNRIVVGWKNIIFPAPEVELADLDAYIASLRKVQNAVRENSNTYEEAERKIQKAQTRINEILANARKEAEAKTVKPDAPVVGLGGNPEADKLRIQRFEEREAAALKRGIVEFKKYADEVRRIRADADAEINRRITPMVERAKSPIDANVLKAEMEAISVDLAGMTVPNLDQQLLDVIRVDEMKNTLAEGIADSIEGGIVSGLEMGLASGKIGDAFKAMGQAIVRSMANAMVKVAISAIKLGSLLKSIRDFMILNPAAAVAAAVALLALSQAMGGGASSTDMGATGGRGGLSYNAMGSAVSLPPQQIIFGATSATTAAGMQPRQAMNVTIIGPNDPQAQRSIQELMNKANSRGRVG